MCWPKIHKISVCCCLLFLLDNVTLRPAVAGAPSPSPYFFLCRVTFPLPFPYSHSCCQSSFEAARLLNEIQLKALMMIRTKRRLLPRYHPLPPLSPRLPPRSVGNRSIRQIRMPDVGLRLFIVNTRQLLKDKFICTHAYDAGTDLGSDWDWYGVWDWNCDWVWPWVCGCAWHSGTFVNLAFC